MSKRMDELLKRANDLLLDIQEQKEFLELLRRELEYTKYELMELGANPVALEKVLKETDV